MKKALIFGGIGVVLVASLAATYLFFSKKEASIPASPQLGQSQPAGFNKAQYSLDEPGSPWWIVNKKRSLPQDYEPPALIAPKIKLRWAAHAESMQVSTAIAPSLEAMHQTMTAAGFDVMLISGYRSAATQTELYNKYVQDYGQEEADRLSAKPGTSEHQTGLVVDLGRADKQCELEQCFGDLPEGQWLAEHAHEYGFIIRYPKGHEAFVGYMYEPWHLRHVGKELAAELHAKGQTMEEFFGL